MCCMTITSHSGNWKAFLGVHRPICHAKQAIWKTISDNHTCSSTRSSRIVRCPIISCCCRTDRSQRSRVHGTSIYWSRLIVSCPGGWSIVDIAAVSHVSGIHNQNVTWAGIELNFCTNQHHDRQQIDVGQRFPWLAGVYYAILAKLRRPRSFPLSISPVEAFVGGQNCRTASQPLDHPVLPCVFEVSQNEAVTKEAAWIYP